MDHVNDMTETIVRKYGSVGYFFLPQLDNLSRRYICEKHEPRALEELGLKLCPNFSV